MVSNANKLEFEVIRRLISIVVLHHKTKILGEGISLIDLILTYG